MANIPHHQVNHQIKAKEVLLIDENGKRVGVVPLKEALERAEEAGLDLVAVNPNSNPIICRIMDYGKYKYTLKKKSAKRSSHIVKVKEIRLRPKIDKHDLNIKIRQAREFLEDGCKVKFSMLFRGREVIYMDQGMEIMNSIYETLEDIAKMESQPKPESHHITMVLSRKDKK